MKKRTLSLFLALLMCLTLLPMAALAAETPAEETAAEEEPVLDGAAKPGKPALESIKNTVSGVKITWSKVKNADGYIIFRRTGEGGWERIGKVKGGTKVSYTDKTAESGTKYSYTVRAYIGTKKGACDAEGLTILRLDAPTVKSVSAVTAGVKITWNKVTGAKKYAIYRRAEGETSWTKIGAVKSAKYTVKTAQSGVTYTYTVRAVGSGGNSAIRAGKSICCKLPFADVAGEYMLAGNGFWSYSLTIEPDGTFTGNYHDANMGLGADQGYDSQIYYSEYQGSFKNLRQVDASTYVFDLVKITYTNEPGTSAVKNNILYDYTPAPWYDGSTTYYVYAKGTPLSALSEDMADALRFNMSGSTIISTSGSVKTITRSILCTATDWLMIGP